jgi:hypothetical protein
MRNSRAFPSERGPRLLLDFLSSLLVSEPRYQPSLFPPFAKKARRMGHPELVALPTVLDIIARGVTYAGLIAVPAWMFISRLASCGVAKARPATIRVEITSLR